jgi:prepilin-type N-terminal cleavage/methylation domain-containing protein
MIQRLRRRLADQRGFTVMELLVASLLGVVVLLAAAALMDGAQGQNARISGRVEGTQRGRVAMEQVTQRLRSQVCLGTATPVLNAQDTEMTFYADFGDEAFTPEIRRLYVQGGVLREQVWNGTGTPPNVTFPATPTRTRVLASGIAQAKDAAGVAIPYFRYYAYDASSPTEPKELLPTPVSIDDRARLVRVQVALRTRVPRYDERVDTNFVNSVIVRMANPTDPDQDKRGPQCSY